jgi:hypothetical protein
VAFHPLVCIIINLVISGAYLDVALRDLGLALGAFALAKLSERFETSATSIGPRHKPIGTDAAENIVHIVAYYCVASFTKPNSATQANFNTRSARRARNSSAAPVRGCTAPSPAYQ